MFPLWQQLDPFLTGPFPHITLNVIYLDDNPIPNYNFYYYFYNDYYINPLPYVGNWHGLGWCRYFREWSFDWFFTPAMREIRPMRVEVAPLSETGLPAPLPEGKTFTDAFEAKVSGGIPGEVVEVFFEVPEGFTEGDTLTVLSWNGTAWERRKPRSQMARSRSRREYRTSLFWSPRSVSFEQV